VDSNPSSDTEEICAPLSGTIWKILVSSNQSVNEGDTLLILEAMKMETEIKATHSGSVFSVNVQEGDSVSVGQALLTLA
jgi:oxaloacetate decarboxylase alpha subunit